MDQQTRLKTIVAATVLASVSVCARDAWGQDVESCEVLVLAGWYAAQEGSLTIKGAESQGIMVSGNGSGSWSIEAEEGNLPWAGRVAVFRIRGTAACRLERGRVFKLEANDRPVPAVENLRRSPGDPNFVTGGGGKVAFVLPENLRKLTLTFLKGNYEALRLSAVHCGPAPPLPAFPCLSIAAGRAGQGLEARQQPQAMRIWISGLAKEMKEYVLEDASGMAGRSFHLAIRGSRRSRFTKGMFRLVVADNLLEAQPVPPVEESRRLKEDPNWVAPGDGLVSFLMPDAIPRNTELRLQFLGADLQELEIQEVRPLPILGWATAGPISAGPADGGLAVRIDGNQNMQQGASYSVELAEDNGLGGMLLTLHIQGSGRCKFLHNRMLKLEANDRPLSPIGKAWQNPTDPDFINAGDGVVTFRLPKKLRKLTIAFWQATLKNLVIRGGLHPATEPRTE